MRHLKIALVAGLLLGGVVTVQAGMWSGLPAASSSPTTGNATTLPLTGSETGAFDTGLSSGRNPQTETISVDQIKTYVFGNGGSASATANSTATAVAGAATCNASRCVVTSEALTTPASQPYTLNVSSSNILSTSIVLANVANGTNTTSGATLTTNTVTCSGTNCAARMVIRNSNGSALNGTLVIPLIVIN